MFKNTTHATAPTVTPTGEKFYGSGDRMPTEIVDFRFLVTQQIFTCQQMLTHAIDVLSLEKASRAISVLEKMLLSCSKNEEYNKKMARLKELYNKEKSKLNAAQLDFFKNKMLHSYLLKKWEYLLAMASSTGVTHIEKVIDEI